MALSKSDIAPQQRLIVALDTPDAAAARALVDAIGDAAEFYKLGLGLLGTGEYFELIEWLKQREKRVFADLKFFDVPETVRSAVRQMNGRGIDFVTVHGNDAMLAAAAEEAKETGVLAVTALTSLDAGDLAALGFQCDIGDLVLSRARRALALGCAGVVSSGLEVARLRDEMGADAAGFLIVTPGIRPLENRPAEDDQKRTVPLAEAFCAGADYVVVGRPITRADNPATAAFNMQREIAALFQPRQ